MNKNILIGALVVIIAILGFTILKPKNSLAPATIPNGQTTTINNPDGKDYQPLSTNCTSSNPPSITVLSPNGGEVYQAGKKITVNWESCNLAKTTPIQILLQANFTGGAWNTSPGSTFDLGSTGYGKGKLLNSGSATLVLPTQGSTQWTGYSKTMKYGNYYKVYVSQNLADYIDASDMSDNSFTINDSSISTVLPKYIGDQEGWPPVIKTSDVAYSCKPGTGNPDQDEKTVEKTINDNTYCIHTTSDGTAGAIYWTRTYTTSLKGSGGTEMTTFTLRYQSCGVWQGDGTSKYDECKVAQSTFNSNLDAIIDNAFTQNDSNFLSTIPNQYVNLRPWPPVVKTSTVAYSCKIPSSNPDPEALTIEKAIAGKKFCITTVSGVGAGQLHINYTYVIASGTGTKSTNFEMGTTNGCGAYGEPDFSKCQAAKAKFAAFNLDEYIANLMK